MQRGTKRVIGGVVVLLLLAGSVFWLARPSGEVTPSGTGLRVVAAENCWGDIAQQLGGTHVQVQSIITNPTADPHIYESDARDAAAVASADVVIDNGLGYDDFMSKLLSAAPDNGRTVLTAAHVLGLQADANQHLWYSLPYASRFADAISAAYVAKDPAHTNDYAHNLATFKASLQPLEQMVTIIRQRYAGAPVAYTEPVPGYLLAAAGLDVRTPLSFARSIEDGNDPSPADTNAMDALMTTRAVKALLYNAQATSPVTEQVKALARQAGVPIVGVSETLPTNAKSYQAWQGAQMQQLLDALGA